MSSSCSSGAERPRKKTRIRSPPVRDGAPLPSLTVIVNVASVRSSAQRSPSPSTLHCAARCLARSSWSSARGTTSGRRPGDEGLSARRAPRAGAKCCGSSATVDVLRAGHHGRRFSGGRCDAALPLRPVSARPGDSARGVRSLVRRRANAGAPSAVDSYLLARLLRMERFSCSES
eukprot:3057365-Prymnesium_polylepis.2